MITKEEFLTHFFGTLNKENLDYFVFGEYACLPQDTGGSDIDIFVSIHDTPAILSILRTVIDANDIQLASYYHSSNPNWFVRLITSTWGVQIDFFGGGSYVENGLLLSSRFFAFKRHYVPRHKSFGYPSGLLPRLL